MVDSTSNGMKHVVLIHPISDRQISQTPFILNP